MFMRTWSQMMDGVARRLVILFAVMLFVSACQPAVTTYRPPNKNELQVFSDAQGITPIVDKLLDDSIVLLYENSTSFGYYTLTVREPEGVLIAKSNASAAKSDQPILIIGQLTGDRPFIAVVVQGAALSAETAAIEVTLDSQNYLGATTDGHKGAILVSPSPVKDWRTLTLYDAQGKVLYRQENPPPHQLRVVNSGSEDIRNLTVLFPGPTVDAPATRVEFGDVLAGETTVYRDVPSGVYKYAAYEYTLDSRMLNQAVVDWVGETPLEGEKFTYRIELDPKKEPGGQIQLLEVWVELTTAPALPPLTFTAPSQVATGVKPSVTSTPTRRPTATAASTEIVETPTATPDIAGTITATIQPRLYGSYPSPDHKWEAEVLIYDCTQVVEEEKNAYEQLKLIHLEDSVEKIADSQLQYCGGLGAYGLAGLFWSPNSRYFYYTTAREGVPDGCGYWERPLTRLDVTNLNTEYLGGGLRSSDGTKIAAWQDRDLVVWDINGDEISRTAAAVTTAEIGPIAWSPNSQSLVYTQIKSHCPFSGKSYIVRLDLPELKSTMLIESERPSLGSPVWETPGQIRLFDENGKEWRYTFATKEVTPAP